MQERVVLVDRCGRAIGVALKHAAHRAARRHRAFSVFVFNEAGALLLQRRSKRKYHSAGLWSNTACGHPRPREAVIAAARRRLTEEMGLRCTLRRMGAFTYRAAVEGGGWEHEYDHVFAGTTSDHPTPDPAEVSGWEWITAAALIVRLRNAPDRFTVWFPLALAHLCSRIEAPGGAASSAAIRNRSALAPSLRRDELLSFSLRKWIFSWRRSMNAWSSSKR